jgi:hypothetical protein
MSNSQRPTNSASSFASAPCRLRQPWTILLAGVIAFWAATPVAPVHADDDEGTWAGTDFPDQASVHPTPGTTVSEAQVYKDSNGRYYMVSLVNHRYDTFYFSKGATVHWINNGVAGQGVQPAPPPGSPGDQFDNGIKDFLLREIPGLTPQTPGVGTSLFALELPSALQLLGNSAQLWGDLSPLTKTEGVIGLDQGSSLLSIVGSSTPDGLTPVLYQYNPETTGFSISLTNPEEISFDPGSTYLPPVQSTDYMVTGAAVPEPTSLILLLGGCAGVWARLAWRNRGKAPVVAYK